MINKETLTSWKLQLTLAVFTLEYSLLFFVYYKLLNTNQKINLASHDNSSVTTFETLVAAQSQYTSWVTVLIIICCITSFLIPTAVAQGVIPQLRKSIKIFTRISEGKLSNKIDFKASGEVKALRNALNAMQNQLQGVISQLTHSSATVIDQTNKIDNAGESLHQQISKQEKTIMGANQRLLEISDSVKERSVLFITVDDLSKQALFEVKHSQELLEHSVKAMNSVNTSNKQIADIISMIDDITFQTNLLSLNAAVEAARSGEHGKGFAVVANEVRNLAGRSANAADKIKALIDEGSKKSQAGVNHINATAEKLHSTLIMVEKVSQHVREISDNAKCQTNEIDSIYQEVSEISKMIATSNDLIQKTRQCNQKLSTQAQSLDEIVSYFSTKQ